MDKSTLIGFLLGIICVVVSILLGGRLSLFFDVPSLLIVVGGTAAALLISFPLKQFTGAFKSARHAFSEKEEDPKKIIGKINNLAQIARREGILALEDVIQSEQDEFLKKGVQLAVDGTDVELIRDILDTELSYIEDRHKENQKFWEGVAEFGPAWGMVGTLIGLIAMLDGLDDPTTIGPKMSVALITTFYGSILANLVAIPILNKLKLRSSHEMLLKQVTIEGILSLQAGESPSVIEQKLKAFLSPALQEKTITSKEEH